MKAQRKIGLFGGSFDPIHLGHLIIAEHFREELMLDYVFFIPAFLSPFKIDDRMFCDPSHRFNMLELAIEGNYFFRIDDIELNRGGISYTFETVNYFKNRYPDDKLFLLIGLDQAREFTKWHNWQNILDNAQLCIANRKTEPQEKYFIEEQITYNAHKPIWLKTAEIEISATKIREKVKNFESIKYLVNNKVEDYIYVNKLYQVE